MAKTLLKNYMPALYRIRVQGVLNDRWSERLGGMSITCDVELAQDYPVTTLAGRLLDQAALLGVLNTLYDLHLSLLLVECLGIDPPDNLGKASAQ